jgi:hypothetical protein
MIELEMIIEKIKLFKKVFRPPRSRWGVRNREAEQSKMSKTSAIAREKKKNKND